METYFENTEGEYIISISTGTGGEEIAKEEYDNIVRKLKDLAEKSKVLFSQL